MGTPLPPLTHGVEIFFVDAGFVIDLVGLAWLTCSLVLVLLSSRQRISVSWAWVSSACQSFTAALGAELVGWAAYAPHMIPQAGKADPNLLERVSAISLPVMVPIAVLIWTTFLIWLLVDRARLNRRGPSRNDALRSNVIKT